MCDLDGFSKIQSQLLLLFYSLYCTEGLTATCAAALGLPNLITRPVHIQPSTITDGTTY